MKIMKFGDIVTYNEDDFFVTHRIIEIDGDSLITQGDSNNEIDGKIEKNKIIGKVIFSSIIIGDFIRIYLKYVVVIFTAIIIVINGYWIFKERKKDGKVKNKTA